MEKSANSTQVANLFGRCSTSGEQEQHSLMMVIVFESVRLVVLEKELGRGRRDCATAIGRMATPTLS